MRLSLLATMPLFLLGANCGGGEPRRPNVLLVTPDTTRADALSCYEKRGDPTPALDRLAREGTDAPQPAPLYRGDLHHPTTRGHELIDHTVLAAIQFDLDMGAAAARR